MRKILYAFLGAAGLLVAAPIASDAVAQTETRVVTTRVERPAMERRVVTRVHRPAMERRVIVHRRAPITKKVIVRRDRGLHRGWSHSRHYGADRTVVRTRTIVR